MGPGPQSDTHKGTPFPHDGVMAWLVGTCPNGMSSSPNLVESILVDPHLTTHQSNIGVRSNKNDRIIPANLICVPHPFLNVMSNPKGKHLKTKTKTKQKGL